MCCACSRNNASAKRPSTSPHDESSPAALTRARSYLEQRLTEIDGVVVAPQGESSQTAKSVLTRRKLKGFYIESSITSLETKPTGGTRAAVSVILATYPGRDMRAIMQGAATVMGSGDVGTRALEGALRSAIRQLPQAMNR